MEFGDFLPAGKLAASKYGKRRIHADRVRIYVKADGKNVRIGEFDQISISKRDTARIFRPAGSLREISLLTEGGYDITFSGGKVDWSLARIMHRQELMFSEHGAGELTSLPLVGYSIFDADKVDKVRAIAPLFEIEHTIIHYNGDIESYIYEDVMFYNYSIDGSGDLGEVKESVKAFASRKTRNGSTFHLDETLKPAWNAVVENQVMQQLNSLEYKGGATPGFSIIGNSSLA